MCARIDCWLFNATVSLKFKKKINSTEYKEKAYNKIITKKILNI